MLAETQAVERVAPRHEQGVRGHSDFQAPRQDGLPLALGQGRQPLRDTQGLGVRPAGLGGRSGQVLALLGRPQEDGVDVEETPFFLGQGQVVPEARAATGDGQPERAGQDQSGAGA